MMFISQERRFSFIYLLTLGSFFVSGVFTVSTDGVSVMEGDSVTLHTNIKLTEQVDIKWYFSNTRIAQINGDLSQTCTDVQCNEGTERFTDRLKLDKQTGSLTITNTTTTDSGDYELKIFNASMSEKTFTVTVLGVPAVEQDNKQTIAAKEGESVTLDPDVNYPNHVLRWYFNEIPIAEITGDQSEICTDDQCKERFTDRLKVNPQTGSLTITNTRTTDSGDYKLRVSSRVRTRRISVTSLKIFIVTVTGPSLPSSAVVGICVGVGVLGGVVLGVLIYCLRTRKKCTRMKRDDDQGSHLIYSTDGPSDSTLMDVRWISNETSRYRNEAEDEILM